MATTVADESPKPAAKVTRAGWYALTWSPRRRG